MTMRQCRHCHYDYIVEHNVGALDCLQHTGQLVDRYREGMVYTCCGYGPVVTPGVPRLANGCTMVDHDLDMTAPRASFFTIVRMYKQGQAAHVQRRAIVRDGIPSRDALATDIFPTFFANGRVRGMDGDAFADQVMVMCLFDAEYWTTMRGPRIVHDEPGLEVLEQLFAGVAQQRRADINAKMAARDVLRNGTVLSAATLQAFLDEVRQEILRGVAPVPWRRLVDGDAAFVMPPLAVVQRVDPRGPFGEALSLAEHARVQVDLQRLEFSLYAADATARATASARGHSN